MSQPRFTPERQLLDKGEARRVDQVLKSRMRPPITITRQLDANVDPRQIMPRSSSSLRVTEADVTEYGLDPEDEGKFWFVPGYSTPDGGDIVRP